MFFDDDLNCQDKTIMDK